MDNQSDILAKQTDSNTTNNSVNIVNLPTAPPNIDHTAQLHTHSPYQLKKSGIGLKIVIFLIVLIILGLIAFIYYQNTSVRKSLVPNTVNTDISEPQGFIRSPNVSSLSAYNLRS